MWRRNLAVFIGISGAFLALGGGLDAQPALARDLPWTAGAWLLLLAGGGAFLSFGGDFWTRTGLASLAPAVALPLCELAYGSAAAFPGFSLALGALMAAIFFLGCLLVGGPARLIALSALSAAAGLAGASDAQPAAAALRARALAVHCRPALPFFCANIHVSCSGRTELRTFAFALKAQSDRGSVESAADTSGIQALYENARADWDPEAAYVILRPRGAGGDIKLLANGSYSFRHYAQDTGLMSHGRCE